PRFTLTASGDRIFARLGPAGGKAKNTLLAVRNNREIEGKLLWRKASDEVELPRRKGAGQVASFEGTPVADARSVFIALTEGGGQRMSTYVVCLDAETGALRWARYLGDANAGPDTLNQAGTADLGTRLLSLDGPTVYYQTNLGALAALDAETGQI